MLFSYDSFIASIDIEGCGMKCFDGCNSRRIQSNVQSAFLVTALFLWLKRERGIMVIETFVNSGNVKWFGEDSHQCYGSQAFSLYGKKKL